MDADLATLRDWIGDPEDYSDEDRGAAERACDACDSVEAELSRLREERDEFITIADGLTGMTVPYLHERFVAAEARCARLESELRSAMGSNAALQQALRRLRTLVNLNFYGASRVEAIAIIVDALVDEFRDDEALAGQPTAAEGPDTPADSGEWFIPEGDRQCGVIHKEARATCMKRRGHEGSHGTPQGTWIDGPWCEYPDAEETTT